MQFHRFKKLMCYKINNSISDILWVSGQHVTSDHLGHKHKTSKVIRVLRVIYSPDVIQNTENKNKKTQFDI